VPEQKSSATGDIPDDPPEHRCRSHGQGRLYPCATQRFKKPGCLMSSILLHGFAMMQLKVALADDSVDKRFCNRPRK
jgi:hypothetical protein